MRKAQKSSILEIIKTLYEAHEVIKKLVSQQNFDSACAVLGDCQSTAIQLGELIENLEGEGFVTVKYLEEYCEELYNVSTEFSENTNGNKVKKSLDKKIIVAENSVKNDIKVKLEIVFMPYKASMWDSLESIWMAADADESCDAYVVPIPYYDRNPDHSFGEFHYEGGDMPEYVPVTHYMAYNLEARRPDVIYIHNPYDENNYVTSVDPQFYSHELKKYTECLVYVPYFVVSNTLPEHFANTPACIYADKIIAQSESVCETYTNVFAKLYGNRFGNPNEKFIASGSPKFDNVLNNLNYDRAMLPDKWIEKIQDKKVVLYNTSLGAILNNDIQYLKKIVSVIKYFHKNKDKIILWWRPHPLSDSTYSSMKNTLLSEYIRIIEWYKQLDFGIFDDTPDLHRAIAASDMYYGDRSSLVAMYQMTGKPVMIQNVGLDEYDNSKYNMSFEAFYDDGEYIWFAAMYFNGFFKLQKKNNILEFISTFPEEDFNSQRLYSNIKKHNDKLYFAPFSAKKILVFDLKTQKFSSISFQNKKCNFLNLKFYSIVEDGDDLIFIPYDYFAFLRYNTVTGEVLYHSGWDDKVKNSRFFNNNVGYFRNAVVIERKLYCPCICSNQLVILDMDSYESNVIEITENDWSFHGICFKGEKLWLAPYKGQILYMDINTQKFEVIYYNCSNKSGLFIDICDSNDTVYLFPYSENSILEIDNKTMSVNALKKITMPSSSHYYNGHYIFAKRVEDKIYAFNLDNVQLEIFDCETKEKISYDVYLSECDSEKISAMKSDYIIENNYRTDIADNCNYIEEIYNISDFINYFSTCYDEESYNSAIRQRAQIRKQTISNPDGTAGQKIHENVIADVINI